MYAFSKQLCVAISALASVEALRVTKDNWKNDIALTTPEFKKLLHEFFTEDCLKEYVNVNMNSENFKIGLVNKVLNEMMHSEYEVSRLQSEYDFGYVLGLVMNRKMPLEKRWMVLQGLVEYETLWQRENSTKRTRNYKLRVTYEEGKFFQGLRNKIILCAKLVVKERDVALGKVDFHDALQEANVDEQVFLGVRVNDRHFYIQKCKDSTCQGWFWDKYNGFEYKRSEIKIADIQTLPDNRKAGYSIVRYNTKHGKPVVHEYDKNEQKWVKIEESEETKRTKSGYTIIRPAVYTMDHVAAFKDALAAGKLELTKKLHRKASSVIAARTSSMSTRSARTSSMSTRSASSLFNSIRTSLSVA